jgi:hypothetical protein
MKLIMSQTLSSVLLVMVCHHISRGTCLEVEGPELATTIDSIVTPSAMTPLEEFNKEESRGPTVDISEWFETLVSLTRQLPFIRQILERIGIQIREFEARKSLAYSSGGDVAGFRHAERALEDWLHEAKVIGHTFEEISNTWSKLVTHGSDLFYPQKPAPSSPEQNGNRINLPFTPINSWVNNFVGVAKTFSNSVRTSIAKLATSGTSSRGSGTGGRGPSIVRSKRFVDQQAMKAVDHALRAAGNQLAGLTHTLSRIAAGATSGITRVVGGGGSEGAAIGTDATGSETGTQAETTTRNPYESLNPIGVISRELTQFRELASKLG